MKAYLTIAILASLTIQSNADPADAYKNVGPNSPPAVQLAYQFFLTHGYSPSYAIGNGTSPWAAPKPVKKQLTADQAKIVRMKQLEAQKQARAKFYKK